MKFTITVQIGDVDLEVHEEFLEITTGEGRTLRVEENFQRVVNRTLAALRVGGEVS